MFHKRKLEQNWDTQLILVERVEITLRLDEREKGEDEIRCHLARVGCVCLQKRKKKDEEKKKTGR